MKKAWPVLPAALLVGGVLYGALAYVNVGDPDIPDPWVEAWEKAGLKAQLRGTRGRIKLTGARDILEKPAYEGTTLREYWVEGISVQIAEFPTGDLLPDISEGREMKCRIGKKGRSAHVSRKGRLVLMVDTKIYAVGSDSKKVRESTAIRIFEPFEEAATP